MARNLTYVKGRDVVIDFRILWQTNPRLSGHAVSAYVKIAALSAIPDWEFSANGLAEVTMEGIHTVRLALKELEDAGLLRRVQTRPERGRMGPSSWTLYDSYTCQASPCTELPNTVGPRTVGPDAEAPHTVDHTQIKNQRNKELKKQEQEEAEGHEGSITPTETHASPCKPLEEPLAQGDAPTRLEVASSPLQEALPIEVEEADPILNKRQMMLLPMPPELRSKADMIYAFFMSGRRPGAKKTARAFQLLITELMKIHKDGGISGVEQTIDAANYAKEVGAGWTSIKHEYWESISRRNNSTKGGAKPYNASISDRPGPKVRTYEEMKALGEL